MRLPLLVLVAIAVLSVLLPVSKRFVSDGSIVRETLAALRVPTAILCVVLHPATISPLVYYLLLRAMHFLLGIPVRLFLSGFGLNVRSFSGTSFSGLLLTVRMRDTMEVIIRVDEVGFDIRTMRRFRVRLRALWMRLRGWLRARRGVVPVEAAASSAPMSPRHSSDSQRSVPEPACKSGDSAAVSSSSGSSVLSKRIQLYARGVHVQLFAVSPKKPEIKGEESLWFDVNADDQDDQAPAPADGAAAATSASATTPPAEGSASEEHVLDSEAQEIAAKLAKRLSTILRTYAYFASLFAHWVDLSVSDVSLMVVHSSDMARAGRGITLHISSLLMWAESARESHGRDGVGAGWIPTDIKNSLLGIVDWLLRILKLRRNDDLHMATSGRMPSVDLPSSQMPSTRSTLDGPRQSTSSSFAPKRDRSHKYLSTLALEVCGIRLFPGIEGAQQHMNSRWELVKMLVVQDMMPPRNSHDSDKPHRRGPVVNCQRCTIRNDVITTFWGLPKKVDQSIELGQTHIRAGVVEALLDEIAIMCIAPAARTSDLSIHGLRALNSHLASVLRQYNSGRVSPEGVHLDSAQAATPHEGSTPMPEADKQAKAVEAKEQVHRMLFQLHEILSRLRLEHVGFALRVADLVFDLPLTCKPGSLIVKAPGMLRWRQRNIEIEAGYMWNAISSGPGSTVSEIQLDTEKESGSSDDGAKDGLHYSWPGGVDDMFAREFEGQTSRRSKDSTAFVRLAAGHCQATALRTPSMTPDPRAEELLPDSPGFRMRYCTLYGEMSAFLSEDLARRPSPQPVFSLDIGRPELSLDLCTQLAFDEAKAWLGQVEYRFRAMRRILKSNQPLSGSTASTNADSAINHRVYALVSLMFSDIKAHVTVEKAMYAVRPLVQLVPLDSKGTTNEERIALRMNHLECHLLWSLAEPGGHSIHYGNGSDSCSDSEAGSFATGQETMDDSPSMGYGPRSQPSYEPASDGLTPSIQFRLTSSPITAQWSSSAQLSESDVPAKTLLRVKHGVRARGTVDLRIGPVALRSSAPRVNANIDAEIGEVSGRLREYDFRKWLSMQPLWLVTQLLHVASMDYNNGGSRHKPTREAASASDSYTLPSLEARRKQLTATLHTVFESIRVTILACDNEEDVRSGIEHGTQLCFQHGYIDIRANGGSLEAPHPFGLRADVGQTTLNIECQRATMFLVSAIPTLSARQDIRQSRDRLPAGFALSDLDGFLPDAVQAHIVLVSPQFNFSRQKLEPFRSRLVFDLKTTSLAGVTSVSSVYRWSVFMRHIQYWLRRKRLARRMATQEEEPSPPDDLIVSINSNMLDLRGSLVSPMFFNLDKGLAKCFQAAKAERETSPTPSPEMKLKMPHAQFAIERTKLGTDNDMKILLSGPIATLYGSSTPKGQVAPCCSQPLMSLKECKFTFSLPRKAKREQMGAEQGVRCNNSYDKIDVVFERGAMAFGHQYNMAETIDGFMLLQKGCKRIARKSTSTCHPPLPFLEAALDKRPTSKMVIAALGNPRTFMPPPLRSLSSVKPPPPPTLTEPEDIPTIDFHGPEFSMMVHDDPFETALSRIYQVGLHEQRERLSRLESFETKAQEIREKREQEFAQQSHAARKSNNRAASRGKQAASSAGQPPRWNNKAPKSGRAMRGASTFSSGDRPPVSGLLAPQKQGLGSARTFTTGPAQSRAAPHVTASALGASLSSLHGGGMRGGASASLQDVTTSEMTARERSRARTNSAAADAPNRPFPLHPIDPGVTPEEAELPCTSDCDGDDSNYDDVEDPLPASTLHQRMVDTVNAEIDAARMRLMAVEAREWVKAIRQKMMPPQTQCGHEHSSDDMQFEEIFAMPTHAESSSRSPPGEPQPRHSGPPYSFVPGSWTHPPAPLGRLVMSPVWMSFDTPLSLLEFGQVESYLRFLDPATPRSLKWSILVPTRMRIKCGDIRMQLRDFPFPMFRVPDPYRPETSQSPPHGGDSYDSFYGGVEINCSLIIAERTAHERSLRSVYIPVGPRSKESGIDLPDVGWYIAKSLQFPRIFAALSIMMYSAPSDNPYADVRSFQQKYLQSRLPQLPIMSTWGASYQPVISALMQRMESATSKSADVSPTLPWWDKLRSRMHIKWRMAVIDAPPMYRPVPRRADSLGDSYLEMSSVVDSQAGPPLPPHKGGCSNSGTGSADSSSEKGQMFFLALDGRDPYQVTQKPGGYLFTMRGGVRICVNEGIPGADLWDKLSGHGIYSVPTEEGSPPSATLGEFLSLRCEEFLMGVPIIVDRKSAIMRSMDSRQDVAGGDPSSTNVTPSTEDIDIEAMPHQIPGGLAGTSATNGPQAWKRSYADLLHSIVSDNSARYTFITHSVDRLYYKVLLHLSGGVRLGIGLSSYIPPDPFGYRHNHWDVQPIAPESAIAAAVGGITDAYVGYRGSKLHTSVSLLCPFTEAEPLPQKPFAELYLTKAGATDFADSNDKSGVDNAWQAVPRLCLPDAGIVAKPFKQWSVYDIDALVSPMHSLFPVTRPSMPEFRGASGSAPSAQDLFFLPFPYLAAETQSPESTPTAFMTNNLPPHAAERSGSARPQCRISASAAAVEGIQSYLPLYVSRMMLPVRKGSMYPLAETSDNKLGKCLRSMRLVLDLKNVELAYSQRNFEIKELESRELSILGFEDSTPASSDRGLSPTPSDTNLGQSVSGAKAEGFVRELKARVESFSFNLLLEQTSVKLKVGTGDVGSPDLVAKDASSSMHHPSPGNSRTSAKGDRTRADSVDQPHSRKSKKTTDSPRTSGGVAAHAAKAKSKAESKALRWGVGDASTEIDYLDVRLTQMSFVMPLFMNSLTSDALGKSRRLNGLRFADGSLSGLSDFEKSWISCASIRDLKELDISEAIFSNPRVVCVLWSPRMVYFTQRPEWTQLDEQAEGVMDAVSGSPKEAANVTPSTQSIPSLNLGAEALGAGWAPAMPTSLDSAVAAMPSTTHLHRSLSAQRNRAMSDVKHASQYVHFHDSGAGRHSESEDASMWALHRRNMSVPWVPSKNDSQSGAVAEATGSVQTAPALPPVLGPVQFSFFGNIPPAIGLVPRSSTQPTNFSSSYAADSAASSQPTEPAAGGDMASETKSPTSAMSYKSSFHLLELARSRQRRLTASNSRQTISITSPSAQPGLEALPELSAVDLHRQTSVPVEQTVAGNQQSRMMPTGPDPNVIMRDSRSTQASLLCKRKEMLGTAIQLEQASLVHLSQEFERASSRHSEEFRREMIRRAEHIYELGARRKLINRCLRVLGVDPDATNAGQLLADAIGPSEEDADFDRDTKEVEKVLATLYRHRCLIYSGYLIWTSQVRDELMRFLYIQDCLTAIEYYMSETATKVVRNAMSANGKGDGGDTASSGAHDDEVKGRGRKASTSVGATAGEGLAKHDSIGSGFEEFKSRSPRSGYKSADQRSVASGSSHRTLNIPRMLRRLRSSDRVDEAHGSSKGSSGRSFLWRSKKPRAGNRSPPKGKQQQPKPLQKPKELRKEEYKPPKHSVGSNKFDKGLKSVWDDFMNYRPYYSFLIEFLNSQVSLRVDEKTSTTSAIAVAERVQLHRIMLCNERDYADDAAFGESGHNYLTPPEDESIVKTRSLIELENVQVFTAKRDDFENQAAYFVDCTYGSQLEGSDASQPGPIWPAWIPIELLLSQGKHRARGIFDELDCATTTFDIDHGFGSESGSDNDSDSQSLGGGSFASDGQTQTPRLNREKRGSKFSKAWWMEDLSKYKRLMDRNNGLVVYDKANPHRIQGDTSDLIGFSATEDGTAANTAGASSLAATPADDTLGGSTTASAAGASKAEPYGQRRLSASERKPAVGPVDGNDPGDSDSIDEEEEIGSKQGLSHRANHFAVFLPELNLACTAEQYTAIYETVTELIVFIDPEKAAYMDHLNTILLGMDMGDLRGLLAVIRATQQALRERLPIIQDWYTIQRSNAVLFRDASRAMVHRDHWPLMTLDIERQKARAASLLTLDRHRQALELQLRTAMDLFGAAQKQIGQQQQQSQAADGGGRRGSRARAATRSTPSSRRPTFSSSTNSASMGNANDGEQPATAHSRRRMSLLSASSQSFGSQAADGTQNTIARTIHLYISKATWHMLENDGQPLCDMTLRWATLKAVTTSDQATHLLSEVHLLYIVNRLPNPMFTDLVGPYVRPKHSKPDFCVEKMIRVRWSELAPVGGISIVERFEVDLFPLRLQFSHDIAQKLINYLYPPQESAAVDIPEPVTRSRRSTFTSLNADGTPSMYVPLPEAATGLDIDASGFRGGTPALADRGNAGSWSAGQLLSPRSNTAATNSGGRSLFAAKMRRNIGEQVRGPESGDVPQIRVSQSPQPSSGLLATVSGRGSTPLSLFSESNSMISISQSGENRDQVDQMKKRASSNKTFLNIKIGGSTLCISYQGKKTNNITDLRDFEFHAPTLELRNQVESYYELLMQVKKEYMSVVVHHTGALVKEKFRQLHSRKAWNKTSFGPDWEARKLLIDMDRRVEEDMVSCAQGSISDHDGIPPAAPMQFDSGAAALQSVELLPELSPVVAVPPPGEDLVAETVDDDVASISSNKGQAPLSKYMILDPRKLMGKRLPNVLPRNFTRLDVASPGADRNEHSASVPPLGSAAPLVPAKPGSKPMYSAKHVDLFSAASMSMVPRSLPSSPLPSVEQTSKPITDQQSPSSPLPESQK
ncbi:Protein SABRE [Coemansia spiralis]|uniref:Protein SABRE n=1 Tax=Coemansia spiralis TaxID=417178 RepID=A0A9W8L1D2_9FUNG|nr:Protein SABRE [Coemansia spiralis]